MLLLGLLAEKTPATPPEISLQVTAQSAAPHPSSLKLRRVSIIDAEPVNSNAAPGGVNRTCAGTSAAVDFAPDRPHLDHGDLGHRIPLRSVASIQTPMPWSRLSLDMKESS